MAEEELPPGGIAVGDDPPWAAWTPDEVARRLDGVRAPWCVAAGWALDLYRGTQTREHEDLEIAVPAAVFAEVRDRFPDCEFRVAGAGRWWPLTSPAFDVMHQTWAWDRAAGTYRLDVFRDPHDGDTWICRRDEAIRLPYGRMLRTTAGGVPYQAPEVVLLFKAKHVRPKDEADFAGVLPLLDDAARGWLATSLARVHPGHPWLDALEASCQNVGGL